MSSNGIFPDAIKIHGHRVPVNVSPRGHVSVGETTVSIGDLQKTSICKLNGEDHERKWTQAMRECYDQAVKKERLRLKGR